MPIWHFYKATFALIRSSFALNKVFHITFVNNQLKPRKDRFLAYLLSTKILQKATITF